MAAEGAAARSGAGESTEEAGASEQEAAAEDPGNKKCFVEYKVIQHTVKIINHNNTEENQVTKLEFTL